MSNFSWKLLAGPVLLIAVLAIGYPVFWHYAAARLEHDVAAWSNARRAEGWTVTHGRSAVGGFPMELRLTLPGLVLAADPEGWRWQSGQAVLAFRPWDWRRFRIVSNGAQTVELRVDGAWRRFDVDAASAVFVGGADADGLSAGALEFGDLTVSDADGQALASASTLRLWLTRPDGAGAAAGVDSLSLIVRTTGVTITEGLRMPLGRTVARFDLDARLRGGLPRDFSAAAVDAWRTGGGTIEILASNLRWGVAAVRATGAVTLDEEMRPAGALHTQLQGYAEAVAALEGAGLIRRRNAATVQIALGLLARDGPDGTRTVSLPVTARGGALYLGPVRAFRLRPIPFLVPSARTTPPGASR